MSCELSAKQTVHMKYPALFSMKNIKNRTKFDSPLLRINYKVQWTADIAVREKVMKEQKTCKKKQKNNIESWTFKFGHKVTIKLLLYMLEIIGHIRKNLILFLTPLQLLFLICHYISSRALSKAFEHRNFVARYQQETSRITVAKVVSLVTMDASLQYWSKHSYTL